MSCHVVMHMLSSIDGRIVTEGWPLDGTDIFTPYARIAGELQGDAWIVGRVTMAEMAGGERRPARASESYPRQTWRAPGSEAGPYAVTLDARGQFHPKDTQVYGSPVLVVLTSAVSDDHLAALRRDGVSYTFAGEQALDLHEVVHRLRTEFGVQRLLLQGGGGINGAFLSAGLVDEISLLVVPVADGARHAPSLIDRDGGLAARLSLQSVARLDDDVLHLRYLVRKQPRSK